MAKGQQRSNRELKKPKQNKDKKAGGAPSAVTDAFRTPVSKPGKPAKH